MSFLQRAKELLGLGDEEYYDDDHDDDDYYDVDESDDEETPSSRSVYRSPYSESSSAVRRMDREPDVDRARSAGAQPQVQMHIVEPRTFGEAQSIADRYKLGTPVIVNLTMTDPELAKRFIDFASGLTYGLDGGLQKISDRVFMLTPANVEVSDAQRRDLRARGLFGTEL